MASGSSGRANSGSKVYDFAADDILCNYNDFNSQESSNTNHSDPVAGANSVKEFSKSRMARLLPTNSYSQPDEYPSQDMISIVENTMKKYTDNLMRFLEGISSRLSQLELYCYNLDKSIGEMRSELIRDHGEADSKLKFLEKHLQEVHRSVQILRDKQELAETQKELAKIQLAQKESSTASHSQQSEERPATPATDSKNTEHNTSDVHNQQLALALPHQVAPQTSTRPVEQPQSVAPPSQAPQNVTQPQSYYLPPTQLPNPPAQNQSPQGPYMTSDPQYRTPVAQPQVTPPQVHSFPPYQQQWPQQLPQQLPQQVQPHQQPSMQQHQQPSMQQHQQPSMQQHQQPSMQSQVRPPSTSIYSPYPPGQPTNQSPEPLPSSMPMQVPFQGISQPVVGRADALPYGYGGPGRTAQQQPPPQHIKSSFGAQPGDGYTAAAPHPALSSGNAYMMYDSDGGRTQHPSQQPHFQQGGYPPQPNAGTNLMARNPSQSQFMRNHPYNELMEKLVSMGYRGDHVASVIQRLEESGQPVDFNAVLDRLNAHSSGGSQRGWSG